MTFEQFMNGLNKDWKIILDEDEILVCKEMYEVIYGFEKNNQKLSTTHAISDAHLAVACAESERYMSEFKSTVLSLIEHEKSINVPRGTYEEKGYVYGK